ncbi:MAG: lysylphosphatidylglycerol synthase transmembrane domain-containing protein [Solirubrobacteraceae bacterium]
MWRRFQERPIAASALATALAAIAVLSIVQVSKGNAVGRAFYDVEPIWIGLIAGAGFVVYPAYVLAYRSIARIHGHAPLALPLVARVVVAGFGPFAIGGGFGIDKRALHALNEDERSARVRVLALGMLEWAVLAPVACGISIALLLTGARIDGALLWPWAIAVPLGFGFALWASAPDRVARLRGRRLQAIAPLLEGVGALHTLLRYPRRYAGAWVGTMLYWAADIGAFYGGLRAFGIDPSAGRVVLAYATGYVATRRSLPLGGAGITEALMIYSLTLLGEPLAPSIAAVVAYRVFNLLLVATPALIARRQVAPLLAHADRLRRRERALRRAGRER